MLSTIFYKARTNMDAIIGKDIVINNFGIGMTPILFSCLVDSGIGFLLVYILDYSNINENGLQDIYANIRYKIFHKTKNKKMTKIG